MFPKEIFRLFFEELCKEKCFPPITVNLPTGEPPLPIFSKFQDIQIRQCIAIPKDNVPWPSYSAPDILFVPSSNIDWFWCFVNKVRLGISLAQYYTPFRVNRHSSKIGAIQLLLRNSYFQLHAKVAATSWTLQKKKIGKIVQIQMRQPAL